MNVRDRIAQMTTEEIDGALHLVETMQKEFANRRGVTIDSNQVFDAILDRDLSRLTPARVKRRQTREDRIGARRYELSLDDNNLTRAEADRIARREFRLADAEREVRKGTKPKAKKSRRT